MKQGTGFLDPVRLMGLNFLSHPPQPLLVLDAATVTKNVSDLVSSWTDLSGNGRHFLQATEANRPLWVANQLNGHPVIRFLQGTSQFLDCAPFLSGTSASAELIMVVRSTLAQGTSNGLMRFGSSGSISLYPFSDDIIYEAWGSTSRRTLPAATGVTARTWGVYNVASRSGLHIIRHNESVLFSTASNTVGWISTQNFQIGRNRSDSTPAYFTGDIAEVRIYPGVLSTDDRLRVTTALRAKYAI